MAEQFVNNFQTTLSSGINDVTTTIPVAAGTSVASQFRIRIDDEILIVTAGGTGTSWTATRGQESTSAVSHSSGATVTVILTDGALDTWLSEQLATNVTNTFSGIINSVIDWYAENNASNMDHKITNGDFIALIHHDTNATDGFNSPTNAVHTVTTGKVAVVVKVYANGTVIADSSFRGMRLQNTTDTTPVVDVGANYNNSASGGVPRVAADSAELPSVAAGKVIELQTWNNGASNRGRGGFVILKEVDV